MFLKNFNRESKLILLFGLTVFITSVIISFMLCIFAEKMSDTNSFIYYSNEFLRFSRQSVFISFIFSAIVQFAEKSEQKDN